MERLRGILILAIATLSTIFMFAKPAYANPSIGVAAWGGYPTITIGLATLGIGSLAVIAIEAWVLMNVAALKPGTAILASFVINIVSSIGGALVWWIIQNSPYCIVYLIWLLSPVFIWFLMRPARNILLASAIFVSLFAGSFSLLMLPEAVDYNTGDLWLCIMLQVLFGFGLSIPFEYPIAARILPKDKLTKALVSANVVSYLFIFIMAPFFWPSPVIQSAEIKIRQHRGEHWAYEGLIMPTKDTKRGQTAFYYLYKRDLSTPQLLGIFKIDKPIKPKDEGKYVSRAAIAMLNQANLYLINYPDFGEENKAIGVFIDLCFDKLELTDEARKELEWLSFAASSWPGIYIAIKARASDELERRYSEWRLWEEQASLKGANSRGRQVDLNILLESILKFDKEPLRSREGNPITPEIADTIRELIGEEEPPQ